MKERSNVRVSVHKNFVVVMIWLALSSFTRARILCLPAQDDKAGDTRFLSLSCSSAGSGQDPGISRGIVASFSWAQILRLPAQDDKAVDVPASSSSACSSACSWSQGVLMPD